MAEGSPGPPEVALHPDRRNQQPQGRRLGICAVCLRGIGVAISETVHREDIQGGEWAAGGDGALVDGRGRGQ